MMKKLFLAVLLLLVASNARAQLAGHDSGALNSATTVNPTDTIPLCQGPCSTSIPLKSAQVSQLLNPIFLHPTGGGANSDYAQIQNALNLNTVTNPVVHPVILSGGQFNVCQEIMVPQRGVLIMVQANNPQDQGVPVAAPIINKLPSTWLQCTGGTFSGTGHVAAAGHYAYIEGLAVMANLDDGGANCFEVLNNASWTYFVNLYSFRCGGNGFSVNADASQMGGQSTTGLLLRPHLINISLGNNGKWGISCSNVNGVAAVVDMVVEFADIGANGLNGPGAGGGVFLDTHCGGQQVWTNTKIDFNGGPCMLMSDTFAQMSNIWCDNNTAGNLTINQAYNTFQSTVSITNLSVDCGNSSGGSNGQPAVTFHGDVMINLTGLYVRNDCPAVFFADGTMEVGSVITQPPNAVTVYLDANSQNVIEPFIVAPGKGYYGSTLTGTSFSFTFAGGWRNIDVALTSACGSLPTGCTLANPPAVPHGLAGVFVFHQDGTGNRGISTYGTAFLTSTLPTLSTSPGAQDFVPFMTDNTGKIAFLQPQLNAH